MFFHCINMQEWYQPMLLLIYLTLFYAYMCIFSVAFRAWVRHNNRRFWMRSGVTHWKEYHFEWFSYLECEWKMSFYISNFLIFSFWFILRHLRSDFNQFKSQGNTQVVVAESIPVTWPKTRHFIGSNQIFNHGHEIIQHHICDFIRVFCLPICHN